MHFSTLFFADSCIHAVPLIIGLFWKLDFDLHCGRLRDDLVGTRGERLIYQFAERTANSSNPAAQLLGSYTINQNCSTRGL